MPDFHDCGRTPWLDTRSAAVVRDMAPYVIAGLLLRLLWLNTATGTLVYVQADEAARVALSVARGGGLADAFPGTGPTAHLLPTMPLIAGGLLRLFGPASPLGWAMLGVFSAVQVVLGYALLYHLFGTTGMAAVVRRSGFILLCLVPVFVAQESIDFRFWEGALGALLASLNLILLARVRTGAVVSTRYLVLSGAAAAAAFFVSPVSGLGIVLCWVVFAPGQLGLARTATLGAAALIGLACLVTPWTVRNVSAVGHPVLIRDNFGLELALANYPGAIDAADPRVAFFERYEAIHPYQSPAARRTLRAVGGEVQYAALLGADSKRWITQNPLIFGRLVLRHIGQFIAPDPWRFIGFGAREVRSVLLRTINGLGLVGLVLGLYRRRRGYGPIALYITTVTLIYGLVEPIPRYTYLVYGLLAFLAVDLMADGASLVRDSFHNRFDHNRTRTIAE